ncbi:uncharacterized protein METZ01_LOCUS146689, partial [marine metagenome]
MRKRRRQPPWETSAVEIDTAFACPVLAPLLGGSSGVEDGAHDLVVTGATTQIAGQPVPNLVLAGIGIGVKQGFACHQETGRANTTL